MVTQRKSKIFFTLIIRYIEKILIWSGVFIGSLLMINVVVAVIFRYVLKSPVYWADELSLILFAWLTFIGGALALKRSELAAVTILLDKLPLRTVKYIHFLNQFLIILFSSIMIIYSIKWLGSPSVQNMVSPTLKVSMFWIYSIIPISFLFMIIFSVGHLFDKATDREEKI